MNPQSSSNSARFTQAPSRRLLERRLSGIGRIVALVAAVAFPLGQSARAANDTWSTAATSGTWSVSTNWSDALNGVPVSGDILIFGTSPFTALTDNLMTPSTYNVAGITFASGAAAYTITSGTAGVNGFTLTGGITNSSTSLETINDLITTTAVRTITMTSGGGNVTLGGNISGASGGLTLAGAGVLTLSGSNSFTGVISIGSTSTLQLQANSSNTTAGVSSVMPTQNMLIAQLPSGATIQLRADSSIASGGVVAFDSGATAFGVNSSGNRLTGSLNFDVNQLTSGSVPTTLQFGSNAVWQVGTGTTTFNVTGGAGYSLQLGSLNVGNNISLVFNPTTANMIVGAIGGATTGGVTKNGAGTLTLTGANNYTGNTAVTAGTLVLSGANNNGSSATTSVSNGATLQLQANNGNTSNFTTASTALGTASGKLTPSNGSTLQLRSNTSVNFNGTDGLGGLNGVTMTIDVNNITAGTTNGATNGGTQNQTLTMGSATTGIGTTGQFNITGGDGYTLAFGPLQTANGTGNTETFNPTSASVTIASYNNAVGASNTLALSGTSTGNAVLGAITNTTGSLAVTKSGASTWTLTGSNTYTGATTISAGTLQLGNGGTTGSLSTSSAITDNGTFAIDRSNAVTQGTDFSGAAIGGSGGFTQAGSGTTTLNAANTYNGATTVSGGTLNLSGTYSGTGATTVSGATLNLTGSSSSSSATYAINGGGTLTGTGFINGAVTVAGGTNAATQGAINLLYGSGGTLTLSGGLTLGSTTSGSSAILNLAEGGLNPNLLQLGSGTLTVNAGGAVINISNLGLAANQSYNLIDFGSISGAAFSGTGSGTTVDGLSVGTTPSIFGVSGYSLTVSSTAVQLTTTGASAPSTAYWSGTFGSQWVANNGTIGNFTTDSAGTNFVGALPGATTNVIFSGASATNFTNTLGQNFTINSLTFTGSNGSNAVTIAADGNMLTVGGGGVTVQSGAGPVTLGVNLAGSAAVTDNNSAFLALLGTNSYTGGTVINSGTVQINSANSLGASSGAVTMSPGTTLEALNTASSANNFALSGDPFIQVDSGVYTITGVLADGTSSGTLEKSGTGTLTLAAAETYSGATNINAGTLQLGNGTTDGTLNTSGVLDNAALAYDAAFTDTASYVISGSGSVTMNGSGKVILAGANSYGGATTVNAGTLQVGNGSTGSLSGSTSVTVAGGSLAFDMANGGSYSGNISDAGTVAGAEATGITNTLGGVISGAGGAFTQSGSGTTILAGANTYGGATAISAGTLSFQGGSALPGGSAISLGAGTLQVLNNGAGSSGTISLGNSVTIPSTSTATINVGNNGLNTANTVAFGALSNGTPADDSAVTINFTGANGYLESFSSLALSGSTGQNTTLDPTTTSVTITGNVTNRLTSFTGHFDTLTLDGTSSGNFINGTISNSSGYTSVGNGDTRITKSNTSTWTLAGNNTNSGPTTVSGGILILSGSNNNGSSATASVSNGATLQLQANAGNTSVSGTSYALGTASGKLTPSNGSTLQLRSNTSVSFNGMDGLGGLNGVTMTIDVNNITAGTTNGATNGGTQNQTLTMGSATTGIGTTGQFNITGGDGYTLAFGPLHTANGTGDTETFNPTSASVTIASYDNHVGASNTLALAGTSTGNAVLGAITNSTGSLAVTKSGASTWTLTGSNTYTGATSITGGTLIVSGSGTLGNAAALTLGGGTLDLGATSQTVGAVSITTAASSGNTIQNGSLAGTSYAASNTTGNAIVTANLLADGGAGLTTSGAGTLTLTGSDTYTGATTINSGATLQLGNGTSGNDGTIGNTSSVTDNGNLIFNRAGANTANYQIAGSGNVTVSGSGSQALANSNNSYSGTTTVNGTLVVAGAITGSGPVNVNNGGILGGYGPNSAVAIAGNVNIGAGGTLYPGVTTNNTGTVNLLGNLTLSSSANITLNVGSGGSTYDVINEFGNLTLSPDSTDTLTLNLLTALSGPTSFDFLDTIGSYSGNFATNAILTGAGANGQYVATVSYDTTTDNGYMVTFTAVPEPGTWGMMLGGACMLVAIRRIRRRN